MRWMLPLLLTLALVAIPLAGEADAQDHFTVRFELPDGTVIAEQQVAAGAQVNLSEIPAIEVPEGVTMYWGDVTQPITQDTTFRATFISRVETHIVSYYDETGEIFLHREVVLDGNAAVYDGIPTKPSDSQHSYVFAGWSEDLSSVTSDISVRAVFEAAERECEIRFFDYDRSLIATRSVPYGGTLTDLPESPSRPSTVGYRYEFVSWSITPNGNSPAHFTDVRDTMFVYAYYAPFPAEYTVSFHYGSDVVRKDVREYNTPIGGAAALDIFEGEGIALFYRDSGLSIPMSVDDVVIGNTDVYVKKIPGIYAAERDASGNVIGNAISVSHNQSTASEVPVENGEAILYDISQFGSGFIASIDKESVRLAAEKVGSGTLLKMSVPRGSVSMKASDMLLLAEGGDITLSVSNGPSSIRMASALKRINYSAFYSVALKVGGRSITDLTEMGSEAKLSFPVDLAEGLNGAAWNISSKGVLTQMESEYDGREVSFRSPIIQFYAVGTDSENAGTVKEQVIVPTGKTSFSRVSVGSGYAAELTSMSIDNLGDILFLPSSLGSNALVSVAQGALNDVRNAPAIAVPATVSKFSWNNWSNSVADVYFLGDKPEFFGEVPASVTVHRLSGASGWDSETDEVPVLLYDGAYKKDPFSFYYFIIDGKAIVHRYVSGVYVQIPRYVSAMGNVYPIVAIGNSAFMLAEGSDYELYGLSYRDYNLETVEIPSSVTDIMADAFRGSTVRNVFGMDSVVRIWDGAFGSCRSLSSPSLPDSLLYIGEGGFRGCSAKTFARVSLPGSLKSMGDAAFYGCSNLVGVKLGDSIVAIPDSCFANCVSLGGITFPASVKSIGNSAFYNCGDITYVDLAGVESLGSDAFANSRSSSELECVVIGESMKTMGTGAFSGCSSIAEIEAHCPWPANIQEVFSGLDLSSVKYYVETEDRKSWEEHYSDVEILDEEDNVKKDNSLTYFTLGMLVFFIIAGIVSFRYRMKA